MLLAKYPCGASITRALVDLVVWFYNNGADTQNLQSEFFDPLIAGMNTPKVAAHVKLMFTKLAGKVFKGCWTKMIMPPTKELFEVFTKSLQSKNADKSIREAAYKSLGDIISVNPSNLFQLQADVIKHLLKVVKEEKEKSIKQAALKCLRKLVVGTFNYSNVHQYFDVIFQLCVKGFEDESSVIQSESIQTCVGLFNLRLEESQKQGDIRTGFKIYNQQQRDNLHPSVKKKQSQNFLDVPRTVSDLLSFFGAMMLKLVLSAQQDQLQQGQSNIRSCTSQVLQKLICENRAHLEATDVEVILNSLLLTLQSRKDAPFESKRQQVICHWVLKEVISTMEVPQRQDLMKLALQSLHQKQILLKVDTVQNLQAFLGKNQKASTLMNESQHIVLLKTVTEVLLTMEATQVNEQFADEKEILDSITPYVQMQGVHQEVRGAAVKLIECLGYRAPHWAHALISLFLSYVSITNADTLSNKIVPLYSKVQDVAAQVNFTEQLKILNSLAECLASLFASVQSTIQGVPIALATTSFNVAKGMIVGKWSPDQENAEMSLLNMNYKENQRREAGWIILRGLLHLGSDWIHSHIVDLLHLFQLTFSRPMSTVSVEKVKDPAYVEVLLAEFSFKTKAISAMRTLLVKFGSSMNSKMLKVVGYCVTYAIPFFFPVQEKKDVSKLFYRHFTVEYRDAQTDLMATLNLLPTELYKSRFVTLLHPITEIILSEDSGSIPEFADQILSSDDGNLSHQKTVFKSIFDKDLRKSSEALLYEAITLFSSIFATNYLNEKNKVQLLKHFQGHTAPPQVNAKEKKQGAAPVYSGEKVRKMCRIGLTLVKVAQACSAEQALQMTTEQVSLTIGVFRNCHQLHSNLLVRCSAEAFVYLHAKMILQEPQEVNSLLEEFEKDLKSNSSVEKMRVAAVCGSLVRNFDYQTIICQATSKITNIMLKLLKESDTGIRKFALHYSAVILREGGANLEDDTKFFGSVFPACFQLINTEINGDTGSEKSMCQLIGAKVGCNDILETEKRVQVVQSELLIMMFLEKPIAKVNKSSMLADQLDLCKMMVLYTERLDRRISSICKIAVNVESKDQLIQRRKVELLAALIYKGHLAKLDSEAKGQFRQVALNMLNEEMKSAATLNRVKLSIKMKETLLKNDNFEKLINISGENELSILQMLQIMNLMVLKYQAVEGGLKVIVEQARWIIGYKHFSVLQLQEQPQDGYIFESALAEVSVEFTMKSLLTFLNNFATEQDITGLGVDKLITLAFTIISQESYRVKQVGLKLISVLVNLLSHTIEQIGDEDDEVIKDEKKRAIKDFLRNPLLLEAYEAQIYSIIRQNLSTSSSMPLKLVQKNYQLIYAFLTVPICRDPMIIQKIFDMLLEGTDKLAIMGGGMNSHEGLIAVTHLKKLKLVAKLILAARGSPMVQINQHEYLPSKFMKEDQERLLEVLSKHTENISRHLHAALNDCLISTLGSKGNQTKYIFLVSPTKDSKKTLQESQALFIEAVTFLGEIQDKNKELLTALLFRHMTQSLGSRSIEDFVAEKVQYLKFVRQLIDLFYGSTGQLNELVEVLLKLPELAVTEINAQVLMIFQKLLARPSYKQLGRPEHLPSVLYLAIDMLPVEGRTAIDTLVQFLESQAGDAHTAQFILWTIFTSEVFQQADLLKDYLPRLIPQVIEHEEVVPFLLSQIEPSDPTKALIIYSILAKVEGQAGEDYRPILEQLSTYQPFMQIYLARMRPSVGLTFVDKTLYSAKYAELYEKINCCTVQDEDLMLLISMYKKAESSEARSKLAGDYLSLLLTVAQARDLAAPIRHRAVEHLVEVFKTDQQAFKLYAAPNQQGVSDLTAPERALIQKVIAADAQKQGSVQTQQKVEAQPLASAGGNKIKLGFNFKKK